MIALCLRQASALLWLRTTLIRRRIVQERELGRAVLTALGLTIGAFCSVGLAALILAAAFELARAPQEVARRGGPLAVFATWLAIALIGRLWFSVRSLAGAGPFLDPRRFLPYAVPARVVSIINFAAALLEPTWLFFYAPLAAIAFGVARMPGAPPFWALLAAEAVTTVAVAGLLHFLSALGSVLESRPMVQRALLVIVGFGGFAALQLAMARPGQLGLARLFAEGRWEIVALTPPGWAAVLARALADGSVVHAFTPALLLVSMGGLTGFAAHRLSLRESRRPLEAPRGRGLAATAAGWALPFLSPGLNALIEKEMKTLLRAGWLQLVLVPAGFLLLRTVLVGGPSLTREPLLIAAAYAHLGVLDAATNAFGRDLGAARAYFLWPVDRRLLFAAKNATAYAFSLLTFVLLCFIVASGGGLGPGDLAIGLLAHAASFPLLAGFGNAASVLWPVPLRPALFKRVRGAGPIGARVLAALLLLGGAWAPYAAAKVLALPLLVSYAGALIVAAAVYGGLLALSVALLESHRERMLFALAKDE